MKLKGRFFLIVFALAIFSPFSVRAESSLEMFLYHPSNTRSSKSVYASSDPKTYVLKVVSEDHSYTERETEQGNYVDKQWKYVETYGPEFAKTYLTRCIREGKENSETSWCEGRGANPPTTIEVLGNPGLGLFANLSQNTMGTDTARGKGYASHEPIETYTLTANSPLSLIVRGKPNTEYEVVLAAGAKKWSLSREGNPRTATSDDADIVCNRITISRETLDENCRVTLRVRSGKPIDVTPKPIGVSRYTYVVSIFTGQEIVTRKIAKKGVLSGLKNSVVNFFNDKGDIEVDESGFDAEDDDADEGGFESEEDDPNARPETPKPAPPPAKPSPVSKKSVMPVKTAPIDDDTVDESGFELEEDALPPAPVAPPKGSAGAPKGESAGTSVKTAPAAPPPAFKSGPLSISCRVTLTTSRAGSFAHWSATASGGTGSYTYTWSGTDGLSGTTAEIQKTYYVPGRKSGTVKVVSGNAQVSAACGTVTVRASQSGNTGAGNVGASLFPALERLFGL